MNNAIYFTSFISTLLLTSGLFAETPVEVTLVDKLDEPRGFCFDTLGFQANARPEDGLQTHSCYSYQGQLGVDQAFDADGIPDAVFRLIEFDLCMTATGLSAGSEFALEPCDGSDNQRFEHRPNGKIMSLAAPGNCVTAGEGPSRHGGGGDPVHLIRDLTLEVCDGSRDNRQQWRLRETAD
ncbi:MAG: ricin-type beta-trefoil lectin domain protein [Rhodospirillaceae bacterium]|nr:ricin-type beta-trefoil lectin domain protein [Rhodospirillaceae bacterium]MDD9997783.1 ricin-type beta-trefoil lectin domain protein [Rhodospirillaceae bacterium]